MKGDPLRIGIFGASGRLGRATCAIALNHPHFHLAAALVHPQSPHLGAEIGALRFSSQLQTKLDLLIDVSIREGFAKRLESALQHNLPLVLGTTGLSDEDHRLLKEASIRIPIFYAPNFSIGMALLQRLATEVAKRFPPCHIDIVETHRAQKKDSPSGSALLLARAIQESRPHHTDVPIHSIRSGETIGKHLILFNGSEEQLTLSHEAHSRDAFARGALSSALFLRGQPNGLYSMNDLLE